MSEPSNGYGLAGHVCVVTGAGSGIGQGIAIALAAEGAHVAVLDKNGGGADETVDLLKGGSGLAIACDVTDQESVEAAAAAVDERFGPVDVLVNNAGVVRPGALADIAIAEWTAVIEVNLIAYLRCSQVFGRPMRERGQGALVHVSSIAADYVTPFTSAYSVSKAGVSMLARQLAVEWGPLGIRSNAVLPGLIYTPMVKAMYDTPGVSERRASAVPSGRVGTPADIAEAVLFLASPRAGYVNGAELLVDGGFTNNVMSLIPRTGYDRPSS